MPNFLSDDKNDGYPRRLPHLAKIYLLQNGWFNPIIRQKIYGGGVLNKPKHFHLHSLDKSRRFGY
jgi:hypothetical protein